MLSWFGKKKREEQFFVDMMRAAAEGEKIASLKSSLAFIGVEVSDSCKDEKIAGYGAKALLDALAEKSQVSASVTEVEYIDGIMLMVFSNHMAYVLQCSFEVVSTFSLIIHFGHDEPDKSAQAIASYNAMSAANSKVIQAVGNACVKWCNEPSEANLSSLAALRDILLQSAG